MSRALDEAMQSAAQCLTARCDDLSLHLRRIRDAAQGDIHGILMAGPDLRCERSTKAGADCLAEGRQLRAEYADDQACWPCIVRRALSGRMP